MSRKLIAVDGVRLKFRTDERGGRMFATATIWKDNEPLAEIATFDLELVDSPGDAAYQGWVDSISSAFQAWLSRRIGVPGIVTKRRKPSYQGEPE